MKVSAIIPTFNHGRFVVEAVESALQQTVPVEVIVVDDGSTDDTRARLEPYGDRIRYVHQTNAGLSAARNTGIRHASGEWLAYLDSDDVWHARKTELQLAAAERAAVDFVGSPAQSDEMPRELPAPATQPLAVRDFLVGTPVSPSAVMVRRRAQEVAGRFDETLRSVEDRDMWLRLAVQGPALQVQSPCVYYRLHAGQMSRRAERMYLAYETVLDKFFREHPEHAGLRPLAYSFMFLDGAIAYHDEGNRRRALELLARSLAEHPGSPAGAPRLSTARRLKLLTRMLLGERAFGTLQRLRGVAPNA